MNQLFGIVFHMFLIDFSNDSMDVDSHIVDDPYADIAAVNALVSPNEKQFELFVTKVSFSRSLLGPSPNIYVMLQIIRLPTVLTQKRIWIKFKSSFVWTGLKLWREVKHLKTNLIKNRSGYL